MYRPQKSLFSFLTGSQLQDIIAEATKSLNSRVEALEAKIANQGEIEALKSKLEDLQKDMDIHAENQFIQLQLINTIRHKEPGKTEISRAEKIVKYLKDRPDHKASFETLRGHLGVNSVRLNEAIKALSAQSPGEFVIFKTPGTRSGRTLKMSPRLTL